jgi:hypothetical protein
MFRQAENRLLIAATLFLTEEAIAQGMTNKKAPSN